MIHSAEDMERAVVAPGFMPFFYCGIDGFSIEELTPAELWFSDVADGPWEWKGPVIAMGSAAYGKFFAGKAGYVSLEWLPDLMNYRRQTLQLADAPEEKRVLDELVAHETLLSTDLKRICGYTAPRAPRLSPLEKIAIESAGVGKKGVGRKPMGEAASASSKKSSFDKVMTRLQMSLNVVVADFEYNYTRDGERYGWGKARYTTPELMYGDEISLPEYSAEESLRRMMSHLRGVLPQADESQLRKLLSALPARH